MVDCSARRPSSTISTGSIACHAPWASPARSRHDAAVGLAPGEVELALPFSEKGAMQLEIIGASPATERRTGTEPLLDELVFESAYFLAVANSPDDDA